MLGRLSQETGEIKLNPRIPKSPTAYRPKPKKRPRSKLSTITNLLALIALFTVVFALQYVSTKDGDKSETEAPVNITEEVKPVEPAEKAETAAKEDSAVVDLSSLKKPEEKKATPPEPTAKKYAPKKISSPKTVRQTTRRHDIAREDRLQSARLVEHLDGNYQGTAYTTDNSSYDRTPHYTTTTYSHDLDNETARQSYLATNRVKVSSSSESTPATTADYTYPKKATLRTRPAYNRWEN